MKLIDWMCLMPTLAAFQLYCGVNKFLSIRQFLWEEVSISNSGVMLPSSLKILMCLAAGWFCLRISKRWHFCSNRKASKMFIFNIIHCVCKQKQIYFFPFGARITYVLVLCVLYFPQMQHTEELWLYIGTVSGGNDCRRYISVYDLCSLLSNITYQILPSLHALTTLPLLFSELGKNYIYKILKTSPE